MGTRGRGGHRGGMAARTDRLGASRWSRPPDLDDENGDPTPGLASQEDRRRGCRDAQTRRRILYGVSAVTMQRPRARTDDERVVSGVSRARACVYVRRTLSGAGRRKACMEARASGRATLMMGVLYSFGYIHPYTHTGTHVGAVVLGRVLEGPCGVKRTLAARFDGDTCTHTYIHTMCAAWAVPHGGRRAARHAHRTWSWRAWR